MSKEHKATAAATKKATKAERCQKRRTKFDFDLWGSNEEENEKKIEKEEWILSEEAKLANLGEKKKSVVRPPKDLRRKTSTLNTVSVPEAGASYNPSYKDHQVKNEIKQAKFLIYYYIVKCTLLRLFIKQ